MGTSLPQISVICPTYNVRPWLSDCLLSLQRQSFKDWEAVFVIDGATDGSSDLVERFAKNDPRVKVVYQENKGQGAARNRGVRESTGRYLFFLDPDDVLPPNGLEVLHHRAQELDADIVIGDFYTFTDGQSMAFDPASASPYFQEKFSVFTEPFTREDITDQDFFYNSIYFMVAWMKLFRADLWRENHIEAPEDVTMGEDFMTVKKMCFLSKRIVTTPHTVIYYRKRKNSATTKRSAKAFDIFTSYHYVAALYQEMKVSRKEWTYLHAAYFEWFLQHLEHFAPYRLWYRYYRKMIQTLQLWDFDSLDPQVLPAQRLAQMKRLSQGSFVSFLKLSASRLVSGRVKSMTLRLLGLAKRVLSEKRILDLSAWLHKKQIGMKEGGFKSSLEKVRRQLLSN